MPSATRELELLDAPFDGREGQWLFEPEGCAVTQGDVRRIARTLGEPLLHEREADGVEQMLQLCAFLWPQLPMGHAIAAAPFAKVGRASESPAALAPNIVFIMTDDQRQDALSVYGNTILRTPNIDRIAAGGVRFTEAFVTNSLCAPSRASPPTNC